jgi:O-acetyl-ADP-ribose deacetylase (regulator of RNase III)
MRTITIKQGSLIDGSERLLVNASNTSCALGSGVSGAIRKACGEGYQEKIVQQMTARFGGPMAPGQVLITDAGAHPRARWVAHAAVMDYRDGYSGKSAPSLDRIRRCCCNLWPAIESIDANEPVSVAMVALGAGTGGLGVRHPTEIACETLREHLEASDNSRIGDVVFYGFSLVEFVNIVEVVSAAFDVPPETIPEEARGYLERLDK